jgi:hypothetical protein
VKAEAFLARCNKVKTTGPGTWLACCPAHDDKRPSMTVRELDDGRVLVHCFSGCHVEDILRAVALDFDALFPDKPQDHSRPVRRPFPAADVLEALAHELTVAALIIGDAWRARAVPEEDYARLLVAQRRIEAARELTNGPTSPVRGKR